MLTLRTNCYASMCATILSVGVAHGADATNAERINALVERAREHRKAGQYDQAVELLRQANGIESAPWLIYSLARVYEDAGKFDLARSHYELCIGPSVDDETRARAEEGLVRLSKIGERGRLLLRVTPTDATITLDGERWTADGPGVELTAGPHELIVSHSDHIPYQQRVEVLGGQTTTVVVRLNRKPVQNLTDPIPPPVQADEDSGLGAWPWVVLSAGVGAGVAGGFLFLDGTTDWDAATSGTLPEDEATRRLERGTSSRNLGIGLMAGGAALVVTSIVLFAIDGSDTPASDTHFLPHINRDGLAVSLSGSF